MRQGFPSVFVSASARTKYRFRAQHKEIEQWFGDDLVMLAYTFIELLHDLPWDKNDNNQCRGASKDARMLHANRGYTCPNETLNRMLPYVETLHDQPNQVPQYNEVRKLLVEEVSKVEQRKQRH
jgi:hypothetical protein